MKQLYTALLLALCIIVFTIEGHAQANSVTLTPASGSPVNYASITAAYAAIPAVPSVNYTIELQSTYLGTDASEIYPIQLTDKGLITVGKNNYH